MSSDDVFWRSLVAAKQRAEELAPAERQEVERQLDEARRAAVPMTPEETSAMVQRAVEQPVLAPVDVVRRDRFAALRRWIVAAAVVLIAHQLIVASTRMSGAPVEGLKLRNTTETMTFQEAISIVVDEAFKYKDRELAQAKVYSYLARAIESLRDLATEPGLMGTHAAELLARVRSALEVPGPLEPRRLSGSWRDLYATVMDAGNPIADRAQALDRFGELLLQGLAALQTVAASTDVPKKLKAENTYVLERIRREL